MSDKIVFEPCPILTMESHISDFLKFRPILAALKIFHVAHVIISKLGSMHVILLHVQIN